MKEVGWLPWFMMILANLNGINLLNFYTLRVILEIQHSNIAIILSQVMDSMSYAIFYGLLIRFQRVQVQLRAQEENTIKILNAINRTNV